MNKFTEKFIYYLKIFLLMKEWNFKIKLKNPFCSLYTFLTYKKIERVVKKTNKEHNLQLPKWAIDSLTTAMIGAPPHFDIAKITIGYVTSGAFKFETTMDLNYE